MVPIGLDFSKNHSESKAMNEFAQAFDSINKIVFSKTLKSVDGKNTIIVRENLLSIISLVTS